MSNLLPFPCGRASHAFFPYGRQSRALRLASRTRPGFRAGRVGAGLRRLFGMTEKSTSANAPLMARAKSVSCAGGEKIPRSPDRVFAPAALLRGSALATATDVFITTLP